jgi:hypothetical protein
VQIRGIRVNRPVHLIAFIGFEFMILPRHDSVHSAGHSEREHESKIAVADGWRIG